MLVKELLEQFNLKLKLTEPILNKEIEGDFKDYDLEEMDGDILYKFDDGYNEVIVSETNEYMLWYSFSPIKNGPGNGGGYDKYGNQIAFI